MLEQEMMNMGQILSKQVELEQMSLEQMKK